MAEQRRGFTLPELLVVIAIVGMVSALTIPAVLAMARERAPQEAARLIHAAIASARDGARGIRFVPSASDPSVATAIQSMGDAPNYCDGRVATYPDDVYPASVTGGRPVLVLEAMPLEPAIVDPETGTWRTPPANPVYWFGNARVGDRIRIGGAGIWYTVVGPMAADDPEGFVNGTPITRSYPTGVFQAQYLLLTNGRDDDHDGYTDEADEVESWCRPAVANASYALARRPAPAGSAINLPAGTCVILDGLPGEIMFAPDGQVTSPQPGLDAREVRIPIADYATKTPALAISIGTRSGRVATIDLSDSSNSPAGP